MEKPSENERIITKIQNLLNLASNNPSEEEAKAALLKAQELMLKYHIENPEPPEGEKVVFLFSSLGFRRKTEFVLMISVVIAENFRTKTVHHGQRRGDRPSDPGGKTIYPSALCRTDHAGGGERESRPFSRLLQCSFQKRDRCGLCKISDQ